MRVPSWGEGFDSGATFALRGRISERSLRIDSHRVDIVDRGKAIEVALGGSVSDPFCDAYTTAERALDILAAQTFEIASLRNPLREYSVWFRNGGKTVLRAVATFQGTFSFSSGKVEVRDPSGAVRTREVEIPPRWHASYAYFRQSQSTHNLHDAYRYLFLALEALLSDVYQLLPGMGEARWLEEALQHAVRGYDLDISPYLGEPESKSVRRFIEEQYEAKRCALFHAKVTRNPIRPGDIREREELLAATRRLGMLYVELSRLITGARFPRSGFTHEFFAAIAERLTGLPTYVSASREFDPMCLVQGTPRLISGVMGQSDVFQLVMAWPATQLPGVVRRAGQLTEQSDSIEEGIGWPVEIHTSGLDILEFALQLEFTNTEHLRQWYL